MAIDYSKMSDEELLAAGPKKPAVDYSKMSNEELLAAGPKPSGALPKKKDPNATWLGSNLKKGWETGREVIGGIQRFAGDEEGGQSTIAKSKDRMAQLEADSPSMTSDDVAGVGSGVKFVGEQIAKNAALAVPSVVAGIGGALAAPVVGVTGAIGTGALAAASAFAPSLAIETGIISADSNKIEGNRGRILKGAVPAAALDAASTAVTMGAGGVTKAFTRPFGKVATDLLVKEPVKSSMLKRGALTAAKLAGAGIEEGATEGAQSPLEKWGAGKEVFKEGKAYQDDLLGNTTAALTGGMLGTTDNYTPEMQEEIKESAIGGLAAGLGMAGGAKVITSAKEGMQGILERREARLREASTSNPLPAEPPGLIPDSVPTPGKAAELASNAVIEAQDQLTAKADADAQARIQQEQAQAPQTIEVIKARSLQGALEENDVQRLTEIEQSHPDPKVQQAASKAKESIQKQEEKQGKNDSKQQREEYQQQVNHVLQDEKHPGSTLDTADEELLRAHAASHPDPELRAIASKAVIQIDEHRSKQAEKQQKEFDAEQKKLEAEDAAHIDEVLASGDSVATEHKSDIDARKNIELQKTKISQLYAKKAGATPEQKATIDINIKAEKEKLALLKQNQLKETAGTRAAETAANKEYTAQYFKSGGLAVVEEHIRKAVEVAGKQWANFKEFASEYLQKFGENIKPHLLKLWGQVSKMTRATVQAIKEVVPAALKSERGSIDSEPIGTGGNEGINIARKSKSALGRALTNQAWYEKTKDGGKYYDVENAYKAGQSKKTAPHLDAKAALVYDKNLMYKHQVEKFRQHPELVEEITRRGGVSFLEKSEHTVGAKGSRWEGKGNDSQFMQVLIAAYKKAASIAETKPVAKKPAPVAQAKSASILGQAKEIIRRIQDKDDPDSQHYSQGDPLLKHMVEGFESGEGIPYEVGGKTFHAEVPESALKAAIEIYENNFASFKKHGDDHRAISQNTVHTAAIQDMYMNLVDLAERSKTPQDPSVRNVSDGSSFDSGTLRWTQQALGSEYGNIAICHVTSEATANNLKKQGVPSAIASISQLDVSGTYQKNGDHRVAVAVINGKVYAVDMPQKEMGKPLSPPRENTFEITSTEFKPRFIEATAENLKKFYGGDEKSIQYNLDSIMSKAEKLEPIPQTPDDAVRIMAAKAKKEKGIDISAPVIKESLTTEADYLNLAGDKMVTKEEYEEELAAHEAKAPIDNSALHIKSSNSANAKKTERENMEREAAELKKKEKLQSLLNDPATANYTSHPPADIKPAARGEAAESYEITYQEAKAEAQHRQKTDSSNLNISQHFVGGKRLPNGKQFRVSDTVASTLGEKAASIDMIANGLRTRMTLSDDRLAKAQLVPGTFTYVFGKGAHGDKTLLIQITKITKGIDPDSWNKEGFMPADMHNVMIQTPNAIEFRLVKPGDVVQSIESLPADESKPRQKEAKRYEEHEAKRPAIVEPVFDFTPKEKREAALRLSKGDKLLEDHQALTMEQNHRAEVMGMSPTQYRDYLNTGARPEYSDSFDSQMNDMAEDVKLSDFLHDKRDSGEGIEVKPYRQYQLSREDFADVKNNIKSSDDLKGLQTKQDAISKADTAGRTQQEIESRYRQDQARVANNIIKEMSGVTAFKNETTGEVMKGHVEAELNRISEHYDLKSIKDFLIKEYNDEFVSGHNLAEGLQLPMVGSLSQMHDIPSALFSIVGPESKVTAAVDEGIKQEDVARRLIENMNEQYRPEEIAWLIRDKFSDPKAASLFNDNPFLLWFGKANPEKAKEAVEQVLRQRKEADANAARSPEYTQEEYNRTVYSSDGYFAGIRKEVYPSMAALMTFQPQDGHVTPLNERQAAARAVTARQKESGVAKQETTRKENNRIIEAQFEAFAGSLPPVGDIKIQGEEAVGKEATRGLAETLDSRRNAPMIDTVNNDYMTIDRTTLSDKISTDEKINMWNSSAKAILDYAKRLNETNTIEGLQDLLNEMKPIQDRYDYLEAKLNQLANHDKMVKEYIETKRLNDNIGKALDGVKESRDVVARLGDKLQANNDRELGEDVSFAGMIHRERALNKMIKENKLLNIDKLRKERDKKRDELKPYQSVAHDLLNEYFQAQRNAMTKERFAELSDSVNSRLGMHSAEELKAVFGVNKMTPAIAYDMYLKSGGDQAIFTSRLNAVVRHAQNEAIAKAVEAEPRISEPKTVREIVLAEVLTSDLRTAYEAVYSPDGYNEELFSSHTLATQNYFTALHNRENLLNAREEKTTATAAEVLGDMSVGSLTLAQQLYAAKREETLTADERNIENVYSSYGVQVSTVPNKYVKMFLDKVAKFFGADFIAVTGDVRFGGRYIPIGVDGRPKIVVNLSAGNLTGLFAHELFHHTINRLSPEAYAAFQKEVKGAVREAKWQEVEQHYKSLMPEADLDTINNEIYADLFQQAIREQSFWKSLARTNDGQGLAIRITARVTEQAIAMMDIYSNFKPAEHNNTLIRNMVKEWTPRLDVLENGRVLVKTPTSMSDILVSVLNAKDRGLRDVIIRNKDVSAQGGMNALKGTIIPIKDAMSEKIRGAFPQGSRGYKGMMTSVENLVNRILDWIDAVKPDSWFGDYRIKDPRIMRIMQPLNHAGNKASQEAVLKIQQKYGHDVFAGITEKGTTPADKVALAEEFIDKLSRNFDEEYFNSLPQNIKDALNDMKIVVDDIHENLVRTGVIDGLQYNPHHYGLSLKWFFPSGQALDDNFNSVLMDELSGFEKGKQFLKSQSKKKTTKEIREQGLVYNTIAPLDLFKKYVEDATAMYMLQDAISALEKQGLAYRDTSTKSAVREGMLPVDDPAFRKAAPTESYKIKLTENGGMQVNEDGREISYATRAAAEKAFSYLSPEQQSEATIEKNEAPDAIMAITHYNVFLEKATTDGKGQILWTREKKRIGTEATEAGVIDRQNDHTENDTRIVGVPAWKEIIPEATSTIYFDPTVAKLMHILLSKDHIRGMKYGNQLMSVKNALTMAELAMSGFHWITIGQEAVSSQVGTLWKQGERNPFKLFNLRGAFRNAGETKIFFQRFLTDSNFANSPEAKAQLKQLLGSDKVEAADIWTRFTDNGGKFVQDESLRSGIQAWGTAHQTNSKGQFSFGKAWESMKKTHEMIHGSTDNKFVAIGKEAAYNALVLPTAHLMEEVIPKVKFAAFAKEYALRIANAQAKGTIVDEAFKADNARDVMKFVEDRFGEVNWKNMWLSKTPKTVLQFFFRSFTWVAGSWKAMIKSGVDLGKLGWFTIKGEGAFSGKEDRYELTDKGIWGLAAIATHLATVAAINAILFPAFMAAGDNGEEDDEAVSLLTRMMFPRVDPYDNSKRLAFGSYPTEAFKHLSALGIIGGKAHISKIWTGRMNGLIGTTLDVAWKNETFEGVSIRDSDDNYLVQAYDVSKYIALSRLPMSVGGAIKEITTGGGSTSTVMKLGGLTNAPATTMRSPAANLAFELGREEYKGKKVTEEEMETRNDLKRAMKKYEQGDRSAVEELLKSGQVSQRKYDIALTKMPVINGRPNPKYKDQLSQAMQRLTVKSALKVYEAMTESEKVKHKDEMRKKINNMKIRKDTAPVDQEKFIEKWARLQEV